MKRGVILLIAFLIVCQLFVSTNGKKSKNKSSEQQNLLKEITSGIEKCVKNDKNIDKKETTKVNKCLTGFKKQKNTLDQKDKSAKSILKKVVKNIVKCLKPKKSKNTKNSKDKKTKLPNKKRQKRADANEEHQEAIARLESIVTAWSSTTQPENPNELSCG